MPRPNLSGKEHQHKPTKAKGYKGVYYIMGTSPTNGKPEKIFYISYYAKKDGKRERHFEKAGRAFVDGMTPRGASNIRSDKMRGKELPNTERREAEQRAKAESEGRYTIQKLWTEYLTQHPDLKGKATDENRYELYLKDDFGGKEPSELVALDVDRLRVNLGKTKEPATVRNVLELLRRIINFGIKRGLCPPLSFRIAMPKVNNLKTEDLDAEQMARLIKVLREGSYTDKDGKTVHLNDEACDIMFLALYTGLRRGEIFKLTWDAVDFGRGFIAIRGPKGGKDQSIPMNDEARAIFNRQSKTTSPYVFPGRSTKDKNGNTVHKPRVDIRKTVNAIKAAAKLPEDFRPIHGLRHVFASHLASSGQVDLYTLQKMMTHKSPLMTQRYAHLRDEAMRKASNVAGRIIAGQGNVETA